jgi:hypothetical protein
VAGPNVREATVGADWVIVEGFTSIAIFAFGSYFAYNYRLQTKLKLLESRIEAYRSLWALTEPASPTRGDRGESLPPDAAKAMGRAIYDWYYKDGNGLFMPDRTRQHLQKIHQTLQYGEPQPPSGDPQIVALSQLRSMLRQDVGVFAKKEFGSIKPSRGKLRRITAGAIRLTS